MLVQHGEKLVDTLLLEIYTFIKAGVLALLPANTCLTCLITVDAFQNQKSFSCYTVEFVLAFNLLMNSDWFSLFIKILSLVGAVSVFPK